MKTSCKIILFCMLSFAFIGCDRATKELAKDHLMNKPATSYFYDTFRLMYVENKGAALSLGANLPQPFNFILLSILPLIVLAGLIIYVIRRAPNFNNKQMLCFSLIISGGIGNIIDRILYDRHVTDFMQAGIGNLQTGIFNVADVCVTAGVIGMLFFYRTAKPTVADNRLIQNKA